MNFFFDYIYYRLTQLMFKRDGRTGGTAIVLISITQAFTIVLAILPIYHHFVSDSTMHKYAKQNGYVVGIIGLILMFVNYRKYDGSYNKYRYHWRDETKFARTIKGLLVILTLFLPMIIFIILGTK